MNPEVDSLLDSVLEHPGMHAITVPALEAVVLALLTLREGGKDFTMRAYHQEKKALGAIGPEVVATRYMGQQPENCPEAVAFYRRVVEVARELQDGKDRSETKVTP